VRASLVSATSLFALLAFQEQGAHAYTVTAYGWPVGGYGYVGGSIPIVGGSFVVAKSGSGDVASTLTISSNHPTLTLSGGATSETLSLAQGSYPNTISPLFTWTPTATGVSSTVLTAQLNQSGAAASVTLSGTGVAPVLNLTSSAASYYWLVNNPDPVSFTVANTGNGNLDTYSGTAVTNLRGTLSAGTGTMANSGSIALGGGATVSLNDSSYTGTATTVSTVSLTVNPSVASKGTVTVLSNFANGTPTSNAASQSTITLVGTGVAPVRGYGSQSKVARVGTTVSFAGSITNGGNGDLAPGGYANTLNNLTGTITSLSMGAGVSLASVAVGNTTTSLSSPFNLGDMNSGTLGVTSQSGLSSEVVTFTYAPTVAGTSSMHANLSLANGGWNGTVTNNAPNPNISWAFNSSLTAVAPVYTSALSSTGQTVTPTAVANGSIGAASATISFGKVPYSASASGQSATVYLNLKNTASTAYAASLTNLSIEQFSIAGANAGAFSVSLVGGTMSGNSFTGGNTIAAGGSVELAISVFSASGTGPLQSSLTIFTDESVALGGTGDTFTYLLTATMVPEPTTMALIGAGVAGLASVRRRRKAA